MWLVPVYIVRGEEGEVVAHNVGEGNVRHIIGGRGSGSCGT